MMGMVLVSISFQLQGLFCFTEREMQRNRQYLGSDWVFSSEI